MPEMNKKQFHNLYEVLSQEDNFFNIGFRAKNSIARI
jgi:hypothetical protein